MTTPGSVVRSVNDHIGLITIANAAKKNALDSLMWEQLRSCLAMSNEDETCRVVVLRGEGASAFSSGADHTDAPPGGYGDLLQAVEDQFAIMSKPVLAAIHGACFGGAVILAAACDVRICDTTAFFCVPTLALGNALPPRSLDRLSDVAGRSAAMDLLLSGRKMGANEALRCGLVTTVVPTGDLDDYVMNYATTIANYLPQAVHQLLMWARDHQPSERE